MNLHEYQAKELLKKYNVPVQEGVAVENVKDAVAAYQKIATETNNKFAVVKAQIHAVVVVREKLMVQNKEVLLLVNQLKTSKTLLKIYLVVHW